MELGNNYPIQIQKQYRESGSKMGIKAIFDPLGEIIRSRLQKSEDKSGLTEVKGIAQYQKLDIIA